MKGSANICDCSMKLSDVYVLLTGTTIMGYDVQIGWGKCVPLPPHPIYTPPDMEEEKSSKVPDPPSGLPFNAQARKRSSGGSSKYGNVPPPGGASQEEDDDFERVCLLVCVCVCVLLDTKFCFFLRPNSYFRAQNKVQCFCCLCLHKCI